jgi:hypothetical protein
MVLYFCCENSGSKNIHRCKPFFWGVVVYSINGDNTDPKEGFFYGKNEEIYSIYHLYNNRDRSFDSLYLSCCPVYADNGWVVYKDLKMITRRFSQTQFAKKKKLNSYRDYLATEHWKQKVILYKRLFPICEDCRRKPSKDLHHLYYGNIGKEKYWDLLALCRDCHYKRHPEKTAT